MLPVLVFWVSFLYIMSQRQEMRVTSQRLVKAIYYFVSLTVFGFGFSHHTYFFKLFFGFNQQCIEEVVRIRKKHYRDKDGKGAASV